MAGCWLGSGIVESIEANVPAAFVLPLSSRRQSRFALHPSKPAVFSTGKISLLIVRSTLLSSVGVFDGSKKRSSVLCVFACLPPSAVVQGRARRSATKRWNWRH